VEEEARIGMKCEDGREVECGEGREVRGTSLESRLGPDFSLTKRASLSCAAMAKELREPKFKSEG
jgi:hypothetical protein